MSYKEKLPFITTFIFDIDGVLTDGQVFVFKNEYIRSINSRDGFALRYATQEGYAIFFISGGSSETLRKSLIRDGVKEVVLRASDKLSAYTNLKEKFGFQDNEVMYMGDDIPDISVLKKVFLSACPNDAAVEVKNVVDYHSPYNGGRHCVRDIIEQILRVQGKWNLSGGSNA